ncbi:BBE domain-containing protein [Streptomyces sp. NPDC004059]
MQIDVAVEGAVRHRPALIVRPRTPEQVRAAVLAAPVVVDRRTRTATLQGGATAGHVIATAASYGLLLRQLGSPLSAQVAPMSLAQMLRLNEEWAPAGHHYALATRTIAGFTQGVAAALAEAAATSASPLSGISVHHFHGAATRVPSEATAFGLRRAHFMVEIMAAWQPGDGQAAGHRAWADATSRALAPHALPGGYPNLLGPAAHDQIAHAYGPHAGRLTEVKERYDPEHVFAATPLPAVGNHAHRRRGSAPSSPPRLLRDQPGHRASSASRETKRRKKLP